MKVLLYGRQIGSLLRPALVGSVPSESSAHDAGPPSLRGAPLRLNSLASILAWLLICAPLTIGAIGAFPIWDDASVWLLFRERGAGALVASHPDRPVMAYLWSSLAISENTFWGAAFFAQALLWPALGLITVRLWNHYFPGLRRFAWVAGCVAVAPLATKVQMVTANVALASFLSVVLAYAALVLFLEVIVARPWARPARLVAGLLLVAFAVLLQEYALSVALVMVLLFTATAWLDGDAVLRRRALRVAGIVTAVTGLAYLVYFLLADREIRADVHPSYAIKLGIVYWLTLPLKLLSAFWWGTGGGVADSLSQISFVSAPNIYAAAYGAVVALLLVCGCRRREVGGDDRARPRDVATMLCFVLAFLGGITPMVLMGRIPWEPNDGMSSRFGLPVLPVAAALIVFAGVSLVRGRFRALPVLILGFAAGHAAFIETWWAVRERNTMASLGEALQPYVAARAGHTVAIIPLPERSLGPRRQWELTARLTANWSPAVRQRFWAYRFGGGSPLYPDEEASRVFGPRGSCRRPQTIDREIRLVARRGHVEQLLWAELHPDGQVSIEPYCIEARALPGAAARNDRGKAVGSRSLRRQFIG